MQSHITTACEPQNGPGPRRVHQGGTPVGWRTRHTSSRAVVWGGGVVVGEGGGLGRTQDPNPDPEPTSPNPHPNPNPNPALYHR